MCYTVEINAKAHADWFPGSYCKVLDAIYACAVSAVGDTNSTNRNTNFKLAARAVLKPTRAMTRTGGASGWNETKGDCDDDDDGDEEEEVCDKGQKRRDVVSKVWLTILLTRRLDVFVLSPTGTRAKSLQVTENGNRSFLCVH